MMKTFVNMMGRVYQDHHGALHLLKCPEISEYISTYHSDVKDSKTIARSSWV